MLQLKVDKTVISHLTVPTEAAIYWNDLCNTLDAL
jgi:hypothetical protein